MHGPYWLDREALDKGRKYMKAAKWFSGEDKEEWERQMKYVKDTNAKLNKNLSQDLKEKYPKLFKFMNASVAKIDWEKQVEILQDKDFVFTSVHGDFWPNNTMWTKETEEMYVCDFEYVGFGNPTIDLVGYLFLLPP